LFQIDFKDAQEVGMEFQYSWLITLIAFIGWKESDHVTFCTTPQPGGARYRVMKSVPLANHKKENGIIFEAYLREMQEEINRAWRITPKVVTQFGGIANFWARQKSMWIQPRQDPHKQWIQMRYCITEGDIDMIIHEWLDEWKIPTIPRAIPEQITEGGASQEET
jgi:hypothetical protein